MKIEFTKKPICDGAAWLESQPDAKTAWANCERGDWMWRALRNLPGATPRTKTSIAFVRWCAQRAFTSTSTAPAAPADAAGYAAFAADYAAYTGGHVADYTTCATDAADCAAYAIGYAVNAAANYAAERKAQADWIRKHVPFPLEEVKDGNRL